MADQGGRESGSPIHLLLEAGGWVGTLSSRYFSFHSASGCSVTTVAQNCFDMFNFVIHRATYATHTTQATPQRNNHHMAEETHSGEK